MRHSSSLAKTAFVLLALGAIWFGGVAAAPVRAGVAVPTVGCAPGRPAVAHQAGGKVATASAQIIPCATETHYFTGENTIGVTAQGTVWFSAADWEWALARGTDGGAKWIDFTVPGPQAFPGCTGGSSAVQSCSDTESSKNSTVADAFLWVDPTTSKIFWSKTYGYALCSSLSMSADDGLTWHPVTQFACPGGDYEKIAGGPPPAGGATPTGYPNVLYGCTNGVAPTFVVGPARVCYKSLDGGSTWTATGAPPVPSPLAPGCLHFQEPQQVGPDGTLYLPLNCSAIANNPAGLVRVAMSHDEGMTWSYASVPTGSSGSNTGLIGGVSMAVDRAGTIYVVWPGADNHPYLAASKDQGSTWTGPFMLGAPGVTESTPWAQVAAQASGHVAIAYYGFTKDPTHLNGYLTESFNAADGQPLFYSGLLNDPKQPLYFPVKSGTLPRNDYLGVTIAPDGTPWAGLVKLLSDTPDSQGYIQSTGFAGRLVPVATATGGSPSTPSSNASGSSGQTPTALANTSSPSASVAASTAVALAALTTLWRLGSRRAPSAPRTPSGTGERPCEVRLRGRDTESARRRARAL